MGRGIRGGDGKGYVSIYKKKEKYKKEMYVRVRVCLGMRGCAGEEFLSVLPWALQRKRSRTTE